MKIQMRYPVLAKAPLVGDDDGPMAFALKFGEFEMPHFAGDEMPLEIDFVNRTQNYGQQYRISPDGSGLCRGSTSLARIAKIEKLKFEINYADEHPLKELMRSTYAEYGKLVEKGMTRVEQSGDGYWVKYAYAEEFTDRRFSSEGTEKYHRAAQDILSSLCLVDGRVWAPACEPYFRVNKGRPLWRAGLQENMSPVIAADEFIFAVNEYDQLDALLDSKVAEGGGRSEMELRIGGNYDYRIDSVAMNVVGLARATVNYYANMTSDAGTRDKDFRLENQSVAMIEDYLKLRRIVEMPFEQVDECVVEEVFEAFDRLHREAKSLKMVSPVFSPRGVKQQRDRWNDRPVILEVDRTNASRPGIA